MCVCACAWVFVCDVRVCDESDGEAVLLRRMLGHRQGRLKVVIQRDSVFVLFLKSTLAEADAFGCMFTLVQCVPGRANRKRKRQSLPGNRPHG